MAFAVEQKQSFIDRRQQTGDLPRTERRQFSDAHNSGRPEVDELGLAIDQYKLRHRRRFITCEELYEVVASLGYHK